MAVLGALAIAFSAILVRLAEQPPSTSAFFRCLYALPVLGLLAWRENRRLGPRPRHSRRLAWAAGLLFAADLIFWHHTIENVGAGLGTVLGNLQVAMVPFVAWLALGEHPTRRVLGSLPLMLIGIVLISGILEDGAYGSDPKLGVIFGVLTGLSYAGFLLVLRAGGADLRRPAGPLYDATLVATVAILLVGAPLGEMRLEPSWPAHGWLVVLALTSQVLGWLLITSSLPRLPAALSSVLLTIQPVGSVLLGIAIFSESPTALQVAGIIAVLSGLVAVSARRAGPTQTA